MKRSISKHKEFFVWHISKAATKILMEMKSLTQKTINRIETFLSKSNFVTIGSKKAVFLPKYESYISNVKYHVNRLTSGVFIFVSHLTIFELSNFCIWGNIKKLVQA